MNKVLNRPESNVTTENLKHDFSSTLDDAEELVHITAEAAGEQAAAARSRVMGSLAHARDELYRVQAQATDSARRVAHGVDDYVHTNPWKTMAFAAVVGAVIGLLITYHNYNRHE